MKLGRVFALLIVVLLVFTTHETAIAAYIGVASGQTFTYDYKYYWNSNDPNATPSPAYSDINQTDWFLVNITGILGPKVIYDVSTHYSSGREDTGEFEQDMENGTVQFAGNMGPDSVYIIPANLSANDNIQFSLAGILNISLTINETIIRTYQNEQRATNHIELKSDSGAISTQQDLYFDQTTGVLVESDQKTVTTNNDYQTTDTVILKLTDSPVWVVPEYALLFLPLFIIPTLIMAILQGKRKGIFAQLETRSRARDLFGSYVSGEYRVVFDFVAAVLGYAVM
jgi:hypothetical protein